MSTTRLFKAVLDGDEKLVNTYLKEGDDPNALIQDTSCLHVNLRRLGQDDVSNATRLNIAKSLVEYKADVDSQADKYKWTPSHWANAKQSFDFYQLFHSKSKSRLPLKSSDGSTAIDISLQLQGLQIYDLREGRHERPSESFIDNAIRFMTVCVAGMELTLKRNVRAKPDERISSLGIYGETLAEVTKSKVVEGLRCQKIRLNALHLIQQNQPITREAHDLLMKMGNFNTQDLVKNYPHIVIEVSSPSHTNEGSNDISIDSGLVTRRYK